MEKPPPSASYQPQHLDRAAFVAYFLGAVFPLAALAVILEIYVLPVTGSRVNAFGLIGLVVSLAALSLGSFLVLRQTTRASLDHMDADNHRLESLLRVSGALASAEHGHEAAKIVDIVRGALRRRPEDGE